MQYDYLIYMFILIGFIYGLYRGIKREISFFIIFSVSTFVMVYYYDVIKNLICTYINISDLYSKMTSILTYANISEGFIEFLICGLSVFIIINLVLNGLMYLIFFNGRRRMMREISKRQRFIGGLLGILVGFELSIVMMIFLNGLVSFDFTGPISSLIIDKISYVSSLITSCQQVLS